MKIDRPEAAQQNRLLRSLQPADFALLAPYLVAVSLGQGQVLTEPGDVVEYVYFPHTAVMSFLAVMRHGQTVETATIGRNGLIGGVAGLGRWRAFARVVVQVPGTASRISGARFRAAFKQSDRLATLVLQCVQSIVVQIQQTAACNALHGVEQRLCRWLLVTQDLANINVLPLTQDFLSQMLGVRRTTVTQAANRLQSLGMIRRTQRGQIEIVDRKALEQAVCECYEELRSRHAQFVI
jgi:CRP-like cAMP-binding protein